jgi:CubicO group peptidase (beta-lactamase class C family)
MTINISEIEKRLYDVREIKHIPGMALALIQNQQIIYARGLGMTSIEEEGSQVTAQTLFRIGSLSKPLTGIVLMRLVEMGKIDLDRPVKDYVDWLCFHEAGMEEKVTLRMLLSHRAGLPTDYQPFGRREPDGLLAHIREELPRYRRIAPPGRLYCYSNLGMNLAGYLAEVVSGKPFTRVMQELLFDPLQMRHTTYDPLRAMTYPLAQGHIRQKDGALRVEHVFAENVGYYPSVHAMSTILDLANFALLHTNGGCFQDQQVLSRESLNLMYTAQQPSFMTNGFTYGLALSVYPPQYGTACVGHTGINYGFWSKIRIMPEAGAAAILLMNRVERTFVADAFLDDLFNDLLGQPVRTATPFPQRSEPDRSHLDQYTGSYLSRWAGWATLFFEGEQVKINKNGTVSVLKPLSPYVYAIEGEQEGVYTSSIGLPSLKDGEIPYLLIDNEPWERIEEISEAVDPSRWKTYEGSYICAELHMHYIVSLKESCLCIADASGEEVTCTPLTTSRFVCSWGVIDFYWEEDGTVQHLEQGMAWIFTRVEDQK